MTALGAEAASNIPVACAARVRAEIPRLGKVERSAGIRPE